MKWSRLYNETPTDPKWRAIALETGKPVYAVLAVWTAMQCHASAASERGTLVGWSDRLVGASLDMPTADVTAIRGAMQGLVLDGDRLTGWNARQYASDDSKGRVQKHRNADVTADDRYVTPKPEVVTAPPLRATDSRLQNSPSDDGERLRDARVLQANAEFGRFWSDYPHKVGKPAALRAFLAARKRVELEPMLTALGRYRDSLAQPNAPNPCNPATWLNQDRWTDQPMDRPANVRQPLTSKTTEPRGATAFAAALAEFRQDVGGSAEPFGARQPFDLDLSADHPGDAAA